MFIFERQLGYKSKDLITIFELHFKINNKLIYLAKEKSKTLANRYCTHWVCCQSAKEVIAFKNYLLSHQVKRLSTIYLVSHMIVACAYRFCRQPSARPPLLTPDNGRRNDNSSSAEDNLRVD